MSDFNSGAPDFDSSMVYMCRQAIINGGYSIVNRISGYNGIEYASCYTVGMANRQLPEIIICGLIGKNGRSVVKNFALTLIRLGLGNLPPDKSLITHLTSMPVSVRHVSPEHQRFATIASIIHGDSQWKMVQVVCPDRLGIFPWENGFDETIREAQPVLYDNIDLKD
jgi:hypothetical protein